MDEKGFWSRVTKHPTGCWLWASKSTNGTGYGVLNLNGKRGYAHRISWEIEHRKPIPRGGVVRHSCDNPGCVRPDHLVLGTQRDNVYDMLKRQRFRASGPSMSGEANPQAKLTTDDIIAILACYKTKRFGYRRLARFFGVSPMAIKMIVEGKRWIHVITRGQDGVERSALIGKVMPTCRVSA